MAAARGVSDEVAERLRVLEQAGLGIALVQRRCIVQCNHRFAELYRYGSPEAMQGLCTRSLYAHGEDFAELRDVAYQRMGEGDPFKVEVPQRRLDGQVFWARLTGALFDPQDPQQGSVWIVDDIDAQKTAEAALANARSELERLVRERTEDLHRTVQALEQKVREQQEAEARIQRLAHYDALTGLPNRVLLEDRVRLALAAVRRSARPLALMFLDLDHFKAINDSLGNRAGDAVLIELARRLRHLVRAQDTVARLGGDEFVLLLPETDAAGAAETARKLLAVTQEPFQVEGRDLAVTPSIGIALAPRDGATLDELSRAADAAMYSAKADGRNTWRFYTSALHSQADRTLLLSNALRRAIERDQLSLVYQPQVDLASGRITGAEALLRWQHSEFGAVSPAEFVPIAESSGLILPVGEWVLRRAALQISAWDREGLPPLIVAVNVSTVQLKQTDLPAQLKRSLAAAGVGVERLEVELTEGAAMQDPQSAEAILNALYEAGTEIAIDDFGTGYSSLAYLKRFPIGKVKIDRSFVRDIDARPEDRAIIDAIIRMANSLGMRTVAEGVETQSQLEFLRERGCNAMQGYLVAKPLTPKAFAAFVKAREAQLGE
jgi:diguanylate cyclase (GGDEF)-like protein/PAS domain S-box-containing protein